MVEILLKREKSPLRSIQLMARSCLENIVKQYPSEELLVEFAGASLRKNRSLVDPTAFQCLTQLIEMMRPALSKINNETLRLLFVTMRLVMKADNGSQKVMAKRVFQLLYQLMGDTNFKKYLQLLAENSVISVGDAQEIYGIFVDEQRQRVSIKNEKDNYRKSFKGVRFPVCFELKMK